MKNGVCPGRSLIWVCKPVLSVWPTWVLDTILALRAICSVIPDGCFSSSGCPLRPGVSLDCIFWIPALLLVGNVQRERNIQRVFSCLPDFWMDLVKHKDGQRQGDTLDLMWNLDHSLRIYQTGFVILQRLLLYQRLNSQSLLSNNLYYRLAIFKERSLSLIHPGLAGIWFALFLDSLSAERPSIPPPLPGVWENGNFVWEGFFFNQGCLVLFLSSKNNRLLPSAV